MTAAILAAWLAVSGATPAGSVARDEVALDAKLSSLAKLEGVVLRRKGEADEGELLSRLIETLHDASTIAYRVAYAKVDSAKGAPDLTRYHSLLERLDRHATRGIELKSPADLPIRSLYLRAKARAETEREDDAIADYRSFLDRFPRKIAGGDAASAVIALNELLGRKGDARSANEQLARLLGDPAGPHYRIAAEKSAWNCFTIKDYPCAVRHSGLWLGPAPEEKSASRAQALERERALSASMQFYTKGIEEKAPGFTGTAAWDFLRSRATRDELGRFARELALHLRAKGLDAELGGFVELARTDLPPAVAASVADVRIGALVNRRDFAGAATAGQIFADLASGLGHEDPAAAKLARHLTETLGALESALAKDRILATAPAIARASAPLYASLLKLVPPGGEEEARASFNYAETLGIMREHAEAARRYRRAAEISKTLSPRATWMGIAEAREALLVSGVAAREIPAKARVESARPTPPELEDWLAWVGEAAGSGSGSREARDEFLFEALRYRYALGPDADATAALARFATENPASRYSQAALTLALDTLVLSKDWAALETLAREAARVQAWRSLPIAAKLAELAGEADFKQIEALKLGGKPLEASARARGFTGRNPGHALASKATALGAVSALAGGDRKGALADLESLAAAGRLEPSLRAPYRLARAGAAEEEYRYLDAAREYLAYLALASADRKESAGEQGAIRERAFRAAWLGGDHASHSALARPGCQDPICQRYEALDRIERVPATARDLKAALAESRETPLAAIRAAWVLPAANLGSKSDRLALAAKTGKLIGKLEGAVALALLPRWNQSLESLAETVRRDVSRSAPMALDETRIARRAKEIEAAAAAIGGWSESPWARHRVIAARALADLYADAVGEIRAILPPKGLKAEEADEFRGAIVEIERPFAAKRDELRGGAWETASEQVVETELALSVRATLNREAGMPASEVRCGPAADFLAAAPGAPKPSGKLREVLRAGRAALAQTLLSESLRRGEIEDADARAWHVAILDAAGARAEAIAEARVVAGDAPALWMPIALAAYSVMSQGALTEALEAWDRSGGRKSSSPETVRALAEARSWELGKGVPGKGRALAVVSGPDATAVPPAGRSWCWPK